MPPDAGQSGDGVEFAGALYLCAACLPEETEGVEGTREPDSQTGQATPFVPFPFAPGAEAGSRSGVALNEPREAAATEPASPDVAPARVAPGGEGGCAAPHETELVQPASAPLAESRRPAGTAAAEPFKGEVEAGSDDEVGPDVPSGPELAELAVEANDGVEAPAGEGAVNDIQPAREMHQTAVPGKTSTEEVQARALVPAVRLSRAGHSRAPVAFAVALPEGRTDAPGGKEAAGRRTTRIAAGLLSQADRYAAPRPNRPQEPAGLNRVSVPLQRPGYPEGAPPAGNADVPRRQSDAPLVKQTAQPAEAAPPDGNADVHRRQTDAPPVKPTAQVAEAGAARTTAAKTNPVQSSSRVEPQVVAVIEPRPAGARLEAIQPAPKSWEGVRVQVPPVQPEELLEARGSVRTLRLNVEAAPGRPVSLLFTAEAGAVRVLARAADPATAEALRTNIESLREAGFEALGSEGAAGKGPDRAARPSGGPTESGHGEGGRRHPSESGDAGGGRTNRNLDRWLEALDRQANARSAPVEGGDEI